MTRESGTGGPSWVGAPQGVPRPPGPQGVGHDPRLTLAFGIADVVAPAPTTYLGGSGVGLRPGLRTPFGPSGSALAEGDQLYLATGYRRTWGAPPRVEGYQWNPVRAVYEPTMVGGPPVNQGVRALRDQAFALAQQGVFLQALPDESAASGWLYRWVRTFGDLPSTAKPYALYATLEAMQPRQPREVPVDPEIAAAMEGKTGLAAAEARKAVVDARLSHQLREIQVQTPEEREAAFQAERVRQRRAVSSLSGSTEADYSYEAWLRDPTFAGEIPGGAHLGVNYLQPAVDKIKADRKKQGLADLPPPQFTGFAGIKARRAAKQLKEANEQAQRAEDALYKKYEDRYWDLLDIERDLEAKIQAQDTAASATGGQEGRAPEHQRQALERAKAERMSIEAKQSELVDRMQARRSGASLPSITRPANLVQVGVMPPGTPMWNSDSRFTRTIKDEPMSAWVTPRPRKKGDKADDGLVQVPSVTALTDDEARRALAAVGLRLALAPGSAPSGRVASQEPDWTRRARPGTAVRVLLKPEKQKKPEPTDEPPAPPAPVPSSSTRREDQPGGFRYAETATVPSVVGLSVAAARGRLSGDGFAAAAQAGISNSARVLAQNPAGGTVARKGATVALLAERTRDAAEPTAMDTVAVPDVHGLPLAEAQRRLAGVHLTGIPTGSRKGHKDAVVATQRPRAGTQVQRGALVELQAWAPSGPQDRAPPREGQTVESPMVAVPDVRGMLPVPAEALLRGEGFAVYFATPRLADWPVTKQAPAPGTRARRGARIDLWAERVHMDPGSQRATDAPTPPRPRAGRFFIPYVIGMTLAEARATIGSEHEVLVQDLGWVVHDLDIVRAQFPAGPANAAGPVTVLLEMEPESRYAGQRRGHVDAVPVPAVLKMEVRAAIHVLETAGFMPVVTRTGLPGAPVASQQPPPGTLLEPGKRVLVVPGVPTPEQERAARAQLEAERAARQRAEAEADRSRQVLGWFDASRAREEQERLRGEALQECADFERDQQVQLNEALNQMRALRATEAFIAKSGGAAMQNALGRIVRETLARATKAYESFLRQAEMTRLRNEDADGPICDRTAMRDAINQLSASGALVRAVMHAVQNFAEGHELHEKFDEAVGMALVALFTGGLSIAAAGATVWTVGGLVTTTAASVGTTMPAKRRVGQSAMEAGMEAIRTVADIEKIMGESSEPLSEGQIARITSLTDKLEDTQEEHQTSTAEDRKWIDGMGGAIDRLLGAAAAPFAARDLALFLKQLGPAAARAWRRFLEGGVAGKPSGLLLRPNPVTRAIEPVAADKVPLALRGPAAQEKLLRETGRQLGRSTGVGGLGTSSGTARGAAGGVGGLVPGSKPMGAGGGALEPPAGATVAPDAPGLPARTVGRQPSPSRVVLGDGAAPPVGAGRTGLRPPGAPEPVPVQGTGTHGGGGDVGMPPRTGAGAPAPATQPLAPDAPATGQPSGSGLASPDLPPISSAPPRGAAPQGTHGPSVRVGEPPGQVSRPTDGSGGAGRSSAPSPSQTVESAPPRSPPPPPAQRPPPGDVTPPPARSKRTGGVTPAGFGRAPRLDYRKTFFEAHPELEGKVVVHHAVEQGVRARYPHIDISEAEMHSLQNLRGIPKALNPELHLRQIRKAWTAWYHANPNATKQDLLDFATKVDDQFGHLFVPPVRIR